MKRFKSFNINTIFSVSLIILILSLGLVNNKIEGDCTRYALENSLLNTENATLENKAPIEKNKDSRDNNISVEEEVELLYFHGVSSTLLITSIPAKDNIKIKDENFIELFNADILVPPPQL